MSRSEIAFNKRVIKQPRLRCHRLPQCHNTSSFPGSGWTIYLLPTLAWGVWTSGRAEGTFSGARGVDPCSVPQVNARAMANITQLMPRGGNSGGGVVWQLLRLPPTAAESTAKPAQHAGLKLVDICADDTLWSASIWRSLAFPFGNSSSEKMSLSILAGIVILEKHENPAPGCGKKPPPWFANDL